MMDIFAFLLLGAAAFAAFNLVSRTVEAQRREIGIGMALGVEPARAGPPAVPARRAGRAARASSSASPLGLAANAWLRAVMETFFPLPVVHATFQLQLVFVARRRARARAPAAGHRAAVWRGARGSRRSRRSASARGPRRAAAWPGWPGHAAARR